MQEFYRSRTGHVVSAKCGGWCGHCGPEGDMKLLQDECLRQEGMKHWAYEWIRPGLVGRGDRVVEGAELTR